MKVPYIEPPADSMERYRLALADLHEAMNKTLGVHHAMLIDLIDVGTDQGTAAAMVTFEDGQIVVRPIDLYDESSTIPRAAWDGLPDKKEKG